ncbi:6-bladed beta-propeller [Balneola vulgaris]|uniref:6-bladed beta-propeller n=1 Tax=Balneola vulgaris TaxID=287535 RepID=UPI0003725F17|nr:6-bladed beta-propeller [Balneola vulgaris]
MNRLTISGLFAVLIVLSCSKKDKSSVPVDLFNQKAPVVNHFTIGLEDQGEEYQLGSPIGVRTDSELNIYIADRSWMTIKVYDSTGVFIREFGGRGRGPGEFGEINTFEITPEEDFFILDRGRRSYTYVTKQGELVHRQQYKFNEMGMYLPDDVDFYDDKLIGLYRTSTNNIEGNPLFNRKYFHLSDRNITKKDTSFFTFPDLNDLEQTRLNWIVFTRFAGSFTLNSSRDRFYYSPIIYNRNLYVFKRAGNAWEVKEVIKLTDFGIESIVENTKQQHDLYIERKVPGLTTTMFGGFPEAHRGRVNTFDMGLYELSDGRLISFVGKWRDDLEKEGPHEEVIDIYAQTLNLETREVTFLGLVQSVEEDYLPNKPLINWVDAEDNFYLLNKTSIGIPSVTKFSIEGL